jgi:hypothetical protein
MDLLPRDHIPFANAAADHAGPDWQERAEGIFMFCLYASNKPMLCEEIVQAAREDFSLPDAPDNRAWGAIAARLARQKKIVRVGYAPAHDASPKSLWRAA